MANSIKDIWADVRAKYKNKFSSEDWLRIESVPSPEGVVSDLSDRNHAYGRRQVPKWIEKFNNVITYIRPLMSVIDTFIQSDPTISALAWGSIKAVIEVCYSRASSYPNVAFFLFLT